MAVIILDLTKVICRPVRIILIFILFFLLIWLVRLGCINSNGRGRVFLGLFISTPVIMIFLLFLLSLFRDLNSLLSLRSNVWRLGRNSFGLDFFALFIIRFSCQFSMHWLVVLMAMLIHILVDRKLYSSFGLNPNNFFDLDVSII